MKMKIFITIENCDFDDELISIVHILEDDLFSRFIQLHIHKEICIAVHLCVAHNSGFLFLIAKCSLLCIGGRVEVEVNLCR